MKEITASIAIASLLIFSAFLYSRSPTEKPRVDSVFNSTIENGVQIVEIRARGGYEPKRSTAIAGIPTILRFDSKGTFDCSTSVWIPKKDVKKSLNFSGMTDIDIGTPEKGLMRGGCTMGMMYAFEIDFVEG